MPILAIHGAKSQDSRQAPEMTEEALPSMDDRNAVIDSFDQEEKEILVSERSAAHFEIERTRASAAWMKR